MKKVLSFVLLSLIISSCFALCSFAEQKHSNLPKATEAPVLDGRIGDGEWDEALTVNMNKEDDSLFVAAGTKDTFNGAQVKFLWNEKGIYFMADVKDNTAPMTPPQSDTGNYNSGDGVQFNIYTKADSVGQDAGTLLFFSYNPKTAEGKACVGEHFVYGNGVQGGAVEGAVIEADVKDDGYVIEGLIPAQAFAKVYPPLALNAGIKIYMNTVIMEMDDKGNQSLIADNEWFDASKATEYILSAAPKADTEKAADTEEAGANKEAKDTTEQDTKGSDSVTQETKDADSGKTEKASSNILIYILIAFAVVIAAAAGVVVAKKKSK